VTVLQHIACAYVRAHEVVLSWHLDHPGQALAPSVLPYAHLMSDLHHHAHLIHGGPVDLISIARDATETA